MPLPPESTLPGPLPDPRSPSRRLETGEPVLEAHSHQVLLFKKYNMFWKKKKKEKVYI